jgi:hypothetical protein
VAVSPRNAGGFAKHLEAVVVEKSVSPSIAGGSAKHLEAVITKLTVSPSTASGSAEHLEALIAKYLDNIYIYIYIVVSGWGKGAASYPSFKNGAFDIGHTKLSQHIACKFAL